MTLPSWFASMSDSLGFLATFALVTFAVFVMALALLCVFPFLAKLNGGDADYEAERADDERSAGHYLEDA